MLFSAALKKSLPILLLFIVSDLAVKLSWAQNIIVDNGDFSLQIKNPESEGDRSVASRIIEKEDLYQETIEILNVIFRLNADIKVTFETWSDQNTQPNAAYYPDVREIVIGYGLLSKMTEMFDGTGMGNDAFDPLTINATHTLLHEVGHALFHVNNMSFGAAEEENRADQLAFILMSALADGAKGGDMEVDQTLIPVLYIARHDPSEWNDNKQASESIHVPDRERGIDYLCWMIGKDPELLTKDPSLKEYVGNRACRAEYESLSADWDNLLAPFAN